MQLSEVRAVRNEWLGTEAWDLGRHTNEVRSFWFFGAGEQKSGTSLYRPAPESLPEISFLFRRFPSTTLNGRFGLAGFRPRFPVVLSGMMMPANQVFQVALEFQFMAAPD